MKSHFTEEDIQVGNMYVESCSVSLAIRQMCIKTTVRYLYTPIKLVKIKKSNTTKCWQGCRELRSLIFVRNVK